ncbi:amino acid adenylation domain-containing protein [Marinomonas sp. C2222]|uniref:Amino acid adenylation domain-containing protein n=1 Tax=Marinomonas sargassi TaxID=2984494 RepID=A0ABT2YNV8_9GAMM|nr:non-ribosomal peptide synthetase [Marinomonas sargassi]MCV2401574.1 amino acid adenylation domain-containing protein [Marinomonas sargassi]
MKANTNKQADKTALAKRFLQLGTQEQAKFISLLDSKGINFEKLPIVTADDIHTSESSSTLAPLSPAQKRMWDIYELDPANSAYHMSGAFDIQGELDLTKLENSLSKIIDKHQILRTRFVSIKPESAAPEKEATSSYEVRQYVEKQPIVQMEILDYSSQPSDALPALLQNFVAKPFDLYNQTPIRFQCVKINRHCYRVQIVMHHLVSDGWSVSLFMQDLITAYQGIDLAPLNIQYRDYATWQNALLKAGKDKNHLDFWHKELGTEQPQKLYEWNQKVELNQRRSAATLSFQLPQEQHEKVAQLARQMAVTTSSFWLTLWQTALAKATGVEDIYIGMPMANRHRQEVTDVIGFFVNTMVIRQNIKPTSRFSQCVKSSHEKVLQAQEHQLLPFDQLVASLTQNRKEKGHTQTTNAERVAGETPLFQALFNHQVESNNQVQLAQDVSISTVPQQGQFALFDIALDIREQATSDSSGTTSNVVLTYAKDRIDSEKMRELYDVLQALLNSIDTELHTPLAQKNTFTTSEKAIIQQLSLPHTGPEYEWVYQDITALIATQAIEHPDKVAIKHSTKEYTFSELETQSNQLAHYLLTLGIKRDEPVGVLFERSSEMIIAMLAIMKAGGAFLPLDPDYPKERLAYMMEDSGVKWVLSNSSVNNDINTSWSTIASHFQHSHIQHLPLASIKLSEFPQAALSLRIYPEQLAYIIYTSGSTGKPKGVAINHQGLSMHVQTIGKLYKMTPTDIELHFASISFDGAVERWTVPLAFGSKLIIRDQALWSAEKTCQTLQDEGVTVACFPPSYIAPLLDWIEQVQPNLQVRSWTLGGEAFTKETYDRMQQLLSPPRIINGYGPTETVVTPMIWRADTASEEKNESLKSAYAPIGLPVGKRRLYVLDNLLNPVKSGQVGELYIGGEVGLARGYLNKPDLTSERFLPDPFMNNGERMYRTGDLVRWNEQHVMEYLGRVDQQVKIRGFRVELGEIENRLQQLSGLETCLVNLDTSSVNSQLIGYLHDSNKTKELTHCESSKLLDQLATELPDYMVPSQLLWLDNIPLTPAGKIDRKTLPVPTPTKNDNELFIEPSTPQEILLANIWSSLLGLDGKSIGRNSHFFALGGDSILCLQLVSKLKFSGFNVTPKQVFTTPILCELALELTRLQAAEQKELPTESFDLMPIQAHFMAQNFATPNHWNQHVCVELKQDMDSEALNQALNTLVKHHPSLRLAFSQQQSSPEKVSKKWQQRFLAFEERNLLLKTEVSNEAEFETFANDIQTSLDITKGHLLQAGYANVLGQSSRFLLVIHHMAIDGVSWRVLFDDLWTVYQQIIANQKISLPINYASLDMAIEQLKEWQQSNYGQQREAFWQQYFKTSHSTNRADAPALYTNKQVVSVELNELQTSELLKTKQDTTSILLTALSGTQLAKNQHDSLSIYLEGHGREESVFGDLDLTRLIGWMTSLYPITLTPSQGIDEVSNHLKLIKEDGGISYGLRYLSATEEKPISDDITLTFNYLGQYRNDGFSHWCKLLKEAGGQPQSPFNSMLTPLVVNSQIVDGKLSASWEYSNAHYKAEEISAIANQWAKNVYEQVEKLNQAPVTADLKLIQKLNNFTSKEKEKRPPIFCIHPVTGRTLGYQKLAQALEGKRDVYGIQSQSFAYTDQFDTSFAQMADVYTATIKDIQPDGPYYLLGWSLGGALCQEVASRLEKDNKAIQFIGLLDCYVPGTEIAADQWSSPQAKETLMSHLELLLGELTDHQKQACLNVFNSTTPNHWPQAFNTWLYQQSFDSHTAENARQMLFSWAVEQHMRALCHQYQLPKIKTSLHAYWAGEPDGRCHLLEDKLTQLNQLSASKIYKTDHQGIVQDSLLIQELVNTLSDDNEFGRISSSKDFSV